MRAFLSRRPLQAVIKRNLSASGSGAPFVFDKETEIVKARDGLVTAHVSNRWSVGDAPNGGLLVCLAIKAAREHSQHPDPLSISAYYVNKAAENAPAEMTVRVVAKSRSTTTLHVSLSQQGTVRSEYLSTFGDIRNMKGFSLVNKTAPSFPPLEQCWNSGKALRKVFGDKLRIANEIDSFVPKDSPFAKALTSGTQGDRAELDAYVRFADARPPCLTSLAFFLDALPPPSVGVVPTSWVPTLEYTVHFWAHPGEDSPVSSPPETWVRSTFHSNFIKNSMLYTDGEIWSMDGSHLLATSRQYARILDKR